MKINLYPYPAVELSPLSREKDNVQPYKHCKHQLTLSAHIYYAHFIPYSVVIQSLVNNVMYIRNVIT